MAAKARIKIMSVMNAMLKERKIADITVSEIVEKCGINRQTFYYHFSDVYDLLAQMLKELVEPQFKRLRYTRESELKGEIKRLTQIIFSYRVQILNAYTSTNHTQYERIMNDILRPNITMLLSFRPKFDYIPKERQEFVIDCYLSIIIAMLFKWLRDGLEDPDQVHVDWYLKILEATVDNSLAALQPLIEVQK